MSTFLIPQIVPMVGPHGFGPGFHGGPFMCLPFLLILGGVAFWLARSGRLAKFGVRPDRFGPGAHHGPGGPGRGWGPRGGHGWGPFSPTAEAEKTLAQRLANGDISSEEYRERLHTLRTANPTPGGPESRYEPPFTPPTAPETGATGDTADGSGETGATPRA